MKSPSQIIKEREERFDEKFCQTSSWEGVGLVLREDTPDAIKSYFRESSLLLLGSVREMVKGQKRTELWMCEGTCCQGDVESDCEYNEALDTLLSSIDQQILEIKKGN